MKQLDWKQALKDLSKQDEVLAQIIREYKNLKLTSSKDAFTTLTRSIVGQQISVKAADSIWNKLVQGVEKIHFANLIQISKLQMQGFGLSKQKSQYIYNIASHFKNNKITNKDYWKNRSFEDINLELIKIKGIGIWTIQMFGIFYLLEPDILPIKDLGLIRAIQNIYSKEKKLEILEIEKITSNWRPWRSVATLFLWRSVDTKSINY